MLSGANGRSGFVSTSSIFPRIPLEILRDEQESSSSLSEDEHGELINEDVSDKFLTTLAKLRTKNPEIYEENKNFFDGNLLEGTNDNRPRSQ